MTSGTPTQPQYNGLYQGVVVNTNAPATASPNSVQLQVPQVLGSSVSAWAEPMQPGITPAVGTAVLVTFLGGNPNTPYYFLGVTSGLLQSVGTGTGTVLNANPFFTGGIIDPWTSQGNATLTAVQPNLADNPPFTYGVLLQAVNGTQDMYLQDAAFPVAPSMPYQVSCWFYWPGDGTPGDSLTVNFGMDFLDVNGNPLTGPYTQAVTLPTATWVLEQVVINSDPNAVTGYPIIDFVYDGTHPLTQVTVEACTVVGAIPGQLIAPSSIGTTQVNFTASDIGGVTVSVQATTPTNPNVGDLWFNTASGGVLMQWTGSVWEPYQYGSGALQEGSVVSGLIAAGAIDGMVINGITINGNTINAADILISATDGGIFVYSQGGGNNSILSSGTSWTCPAGVTQVNSITCVGAGGGGSYSSEGQGNGGGGGECAIITDVAVTPNDAYTYAIGAAGAAGTSGSPNGTSGGNTTWGSTACVANGGSSGGGGSSSVTHVNSSAISGYSNSSGTCTATLPDSIEAGDIIFVVTSSDGTYVNNGMSVKDSVNGVTYTKILTTLDVSPTYMQTHIYQTPAAMPSGGTLTLTGFSGATNVTMCADVFRGVTINVDQAAKGQDNASEDETCPVPALASDATAGALVLTCITEDLAATFTKPSDFTQGSSVNAGTDEYPGSAIGYILDASASTYSGQNWTANNAHYSATQIMSYLPQASGGSGAGGTGSTTGTHSPGGNGAAGTSGSGGTGSATFTTSGSHSWTCPAGVTTIQATLIGAGGGGGGSPVGSNYAGTGGGGGGSVTKTLTVVPGTEYTFDIGAGGSGGNSALGADGWDGSSGGSSTWSAFSLTADGGSYGSTAEITGSYSPGGSGGGASGGTDYDGGSGGGSGPTANGEGGCYGGGGGGSGGVSSAGSAGSLGNQGSQGSGGNGGTGGGGKGGNGGSQGGSGATGAAPGGGGGGAGNTTGTAGNGGSGAAGGLLISWQTSTPQGGGGGGSAGYTSNVGTPATVAGNNGSPEQGAAAVTNGGQGGGTLSGTTWTATPPTGSYGGGGGGTDTSGAAGAGAGGKIILNYGAAQSALLFSVCGAPTVDPLGNVECPEGPCIWQNNSITFVGTSLLAGAATSGSTTSLTDTTQNWTTNEWIGCTVYLVAGAGAGESAVITSNTSDKLSFAAISVSGNDTTSYVIVEASHGSIGSPGARQLRILAPQTVSTDIQAALVISSTATGGVPAMIFNGGLALDGVASSEQINLINETAPAIPSGTTNGTVGAKIYVADGILYGACPGSTSATQLAPQSSNVLVAVGMTWDASTESTKALGVGTWAISGCVMADAGDGIITITTSFSGSSSSFCLGGLSESSGASVGNADLSTALGSYEMGQGVSWGEPPAYAFGGRIVVTAAGSLEISFSQDMWGGCAITPT